MSKERELLKHISSFVRPKDWHVEDQHVINVLLENIEKLLAQPEPELVAWVSLSDIEWMNIVNNQKILELTNGRHNSEEAVNLAVKMTEEICKKKNSNSIPKRDPLSLTEIQKIWDENAESGTRENFVRAIEKAHGIGE